jgi:hypothetical protein
MQVHSGALYMHSRFRTQHSKVQGFTDYVSIRRTRQDVTAGLGVFGISTCRVSAVMAQKDRPACKLAGNGKEGWGT